ncbi:hypothetical protein B0T16DRAFT_64028 [Cercophora newfieldiana]|uniref:Uncharacterized protein n=1 Tax=Cercophora newfieldiana TaxID=92897 RepID=A0AA40CZU5_9PEZI|nr:hypothetical protein B0T16DRAFT_64028 [Cercophora newfieldiana]
MQAMMSGAVSTWAPGVGEQRIHRRYLQIPRKQQTLLNREDAWSANSARVPPEVLKGLRSAPVCNAASVAQPTDGTTEQKSETPPKIPTPEVQDREVSTSTQNPRLEASARSPQQTQINSQDAGIPIPWSSSPVPAPRRQSPVGEEEEGEEEEEEEEVSMPAAPLPNPRLSSPPVYRPLLKTLSTAVYMSIPSSSSALSVDLEEMPPARSTEHQISVERPVKIPVALPMAPPPTKVTVPIVPETTPPSAQIIPCTFTEASPDRPSGAKRRRLMKSLAGKFSPEIDRPSGAPQRMEISSNPSPWLPSRIPASSPPSRPPLPSTISSIPQHVSSASGPQPSTENGQSSLDPHVDTRPFVSSKSDNAQPPNGPISQVPLTAFMMAYPDYRCSLGDFIRGVKVIRDVRDKRRLPEFLYDDLLRVFCGEYMEYIAGLGRDEKPLTAVQWYVDNVSSPQYMQGVLTKENLDDFLAHHPDPNNARTVQTPVRRDSEPVLRREATRSAEVLTTPLDRKPKQRLSVPLSASRVTLVGELASDPIEILDDSQSRRQPRLPSPDLSMDASISALQTPLYPPRESRSRTVSSRGDAESVRSHMQTQMDFTLPSTRGTKRRSPVQESSPVPETLLRPRDSNRPPSGSLASVKGKKRKVAKETEEQRAARLREILRHRLSSGTPGSSIGR